MSEELSTQTDATVEDSSAVDATTDAVSGQTAPLVQTDNAALKKEDPKKERISQEKWQKMAEETREAKAREARIKATLGIAEDQEVDVVEALATRLSDLQSEALRKEFEAQVPKVRNEKYAEAWKKINEEKGHLVKKGDLSYQDLWKMIRDEGEYKSQSAAVQETQKEEQEAFSGSIPFFGSSVSEIQGNNLSPTDKEIARRMGWTDKTFKSAGVA